VQFGVINLGDKQPPLMYSNNVINANTDVQTYDTLGRRFFLGACRILKTAAVRLPNGPRERIARPFFLCRKL